jgi:predicted nuclease of predicted toxin-antitoxin system
MKLWVDAQLSPAIARLLATRFDIDAVAVRDMGHRDSTDRAIFEAAREAGAVVLTKDSDYVDLVRRLGAPPQIIWITCGNTSNARLREVLERAFPEAQRLLQSGEALVEISDLRQ